MVYGISIKWYFELKLRRILGTPETSIKGDLLFFTRCNVSVKNEL